MIEKEEDKSYLQEPYLVLKHIKIDRKKQKNVKKNEMYFILAIVIIIIITNIIVARIGLKKESIRLTTIENLCTIRSILCALCVLYAVSIASWNITSNWMHMRVYHFVRIQTMHVYLFICSIQRYKNGTRKNYLFPLSWRIKYIENKNDSKTREKLNAIHCYSYFFYFILTLSIEKADDVHIYFPLRFCTSYCSMATSSCITCIIIFYFSCL